MSVILTNKSTTSSGTVTSVTFTGDGTVLSNTPSSAVTTTGTLTASLNTQSANVVLSGPASGSAATPTFRALAPADFGVATLTEGTLINVGLSDSVAASALTIALKQNDGSTDPAAGAGAVVAAMRSSTAASGLYTRRAVTAALSLTISSGTTLGMANATATYLYAYLIDSDGAGTMKLGLSTALYDEGSLQSSVAESFSATATNASPCVFTANGHGLNNGDAVRLTGTPPGGFSTGTTYYVVAKATNTFQLSATVGGTAINSSSTGSSIVIHIAGAQLASSGTYTSMPIRCIGRLLYTETTAGTWASVATEKSLVGPTFISRNLVPSITKFTSSGSYATPYGALYLIVEAVGGGGGGGGATGSGTPGSGGTTSFASLVSCNGGSGGANGFSASVASNPGSLAGGNGGSASISLPAYGFTIAGQPGGGTMDNSSNAVQTVGSLGGPGGNSFFGGGGATSNGGVSATANTGSGGGGGGGVSSSTASFGLGGSGGGAGGYANAIVPYPTGVYAVTIGSGGSGTTGTNANAGDGAAGFVKVTAYFQ